MHGVSDHAAKIDGGIERADPVPSPSGYQAVTKAGRLDSLGDAPSDETDQALVPTIDAEPDEGAPQVEGPVGEREGFCEHALLDAFTLAVEALEFCGDGARLALVVAGKQPSAEPRHRRSAPGIDARAEQEAEMVGLGAAVEAGGIGQRGKALLSPQRASFEPLGDEGAVEPLSGTTSQTVASATRSSRPRRSGSGRVGAVTPAPRSRGLIATSMRKMTPAAHR